jgi:hypothetical protein
MPHGNGRLPDLGKYASLDLSSIVACPLSPRTAHGTFHMTGHGAQRRSWLFLTNIHVVEADRFALDSYVKP